MEERTIATKETWKHYPIDNPKRIDFKLLFYNDQYEQLIAGLVPQQMEDKWFIYHEEGWLYFHRSWTGYGIYKAQVIKTSEGYIISEFWAERNQDKYQNDDDETDRETLSFLIGWGLLGLDMRKLRAAKKTPSADDSLKDWSTFGNLMFTNKDENPPDDKGTSDSV